MGSLKIAYGFFLYNLTRSRGNVSTPVFPVFIGWRSLVKCTISDCSASEKPRVPRRPRAPPGSRSQTRLRVSLQLFILPLSLLSCTRRSPRPLQRLRRRLANLLTSTASFRSRVPRSCESIKLTIETRRPRTFPCDGTPPLLWLVSILGRVVQLALIELEKRGARSVYYVSSGGRESGSGVKLK